MQLQPGLNNKNASGFGSIFDFIGKLFCNSYKVKTGCACIKCLAIELQVISCLLLVALPLYPVHMLRYVFCHRPGLKQGL